MTTLNFISGSLDDHAQSPVWSSSEVEMKPTYFTKTGG
jgi:hypothetical protein